MTKIARLWPLFLAAAVVAFAAGYLVFGIGITPLILQAHHCVNRNADPECVAVPSATWHADVGVVALVASLVLAALAAGPLVPKVVARVRRRTSR
jgi:hypothetical protein